MSQKTGRKVKDIAGTEFGRLTVLELAYIDHQAVWKCACICGNSVLVPGSKLRSGRKKSCGCLERESSRKFVERHTKHGFRSHPLYAVWRTMKARCYRESHISYSHYGKRGICVCDEWSDAETFFRWAITHGWQHGLTIDRIDNDGHYEPNNCRFVDAETQANNRSSNRQLTFGGKTMNLSQWARYMGLGVSTLHERLRAGWDVERALSEPLHKGEANVA